MAASFTPFRTFASVVCWLALVVSLCVLAKSLPTSAPMPGRDAVAVAVGAAVEPCPSSHALQRCDLKALPGVIALPEARGAPVPPAAAGPTASERGIWPDVEPDPPRA